MLLDGSGGRGVGCGADMRVGARFGAGRFGAGVGFGAGFRFRISFHLAGRRQRRFFRRRRVASAIGSLPEDRAVRLLLAGAQRLRATRFFLFFAMEGIAIPVGTAQPASETAQRRLDRCSGGPLDRCFWGPHVRRPRVWRR